jgi:glycosyltransferase involved in cell wall biosynthesis
VSVAAQQNPLSTKLLAISFSYPPLALPRAVQVARLFKHLPFSIVLVCADYDEKGVRKDSTLVAGAEASLEKILRVPFSLSGWRGRLSSVAYRYRLPVWDKTPDQYRSWKRKVLKRIESFINESNSLPDAIVSFGSPMSDHLIGAELKRRYRLPWIAHFSDPWVDNAFNQHDRLTRAFNLSLERKVMTAADTLIFTSEETVDLVMSKYPAELRTKARVLPHAFDASLFPAQPKQSSSKLQIRYLGDLYGKRTPQPLFGALRHILTDEPEKLSDVSFELIGPTYDLPPEQLKLETLPEGLVSLKPPVKYLESLALMADADGLLVIDAPAEKSVFLPSKLIDYVGAGRPILGLTPPGAASDLITRLGGWVADPANAESVAQTICGFLSFLRQRKNGRTETWGAADVRRQYEVCSVTKVFEEIVRETLA